jgi:3-dehydroquinate dehydratase-2
MSSEAQTSNREPLGDKPSLAVLNGPNLNLLGEREPEIYGSTTLAAIEAACRKLAEEAGYALTFAQTNSEGVLIDLVQAARKSAGIILNPGGYTHTSVALRDAVAACSCPVIEVHLSNPAAREAFRHHSMTAPVVSGVVAGLGADGYTLALTALIGRQRG